MKDRSYEDAPRESLEQRARRLRFAQVAQRPSTRQRMLVSKKAETLYDNPDLIYRGEDLKRGSR